MAMVTEAQQSRWRLRIKWHTIWITLLVVLWGAVIVGIVGTYFFKWQWTGFADNGNLWDWLNLLFAPVLVTVLPLVIRGQHNGTDSVGSDQQEAALQAYLDRMSDLLLTQGLRESQPGNHVREVARAWTLTALQRVGKNRKGVVLQFLHEACLIYKGEVIIELSGADLRWADLRHTKLNRAELSGVNLSAADLSNSDLSEANLSGANLSEANLSGANLHGTDLNGANLREATYRGNN
jgi:Pentapeptide repeats (8 copies)